MRMIAIVAALFACFVLGSPAPAAAQQIACSSFTVVGNYAITLGGIDVSGQQVTRLLFIQAQSSNNQGFGPYVGVMHVNVHGGERTTVQIAGTYQIFANCIMHILIPDGAFQNTITGVVIDAAGEEILLSSVFDPGSQLTGVMRRRFF